MAKDLFYLPSYKNVGTLFDKIQAAKAPEAFTTRYLADVIGLKSAADRALINMLKKLGFIDAGGRPTEKYGLLKNSKQVAGSAIAEGLRNAYRPLFDANERANELPTDQLKGLVSQVTGTDVNGAKLIAYTFNAIAKQADFSQTTKPEKPEGNGTAGSVNGKQHSLPVVQTNELELRTDFHFNIQVHLPANGTEETYLHIFNALRRSFS